MIEMQIKKFKDDLFQKKEKLNLRLNYNIYLRLILKKNILIHQLIYKKVLK